MLPQYRPHFLCAYFWLADTVANERGKKAKAKPDKQNKREKKERGKPTKTLSFSMEKLYCHF